MFSCLQRHGLQHTRLPSPSLSPGACSNSCPLSQWCYLIISSSAAHFSFCLLSFPASGSFPVSWLFTPGNQTKVLEHQLHQQSFQRILRVDFLLDWLAWPLCCSRGSQESSPELQFESIYSSVLRSLHTRLLEKIIIMTIWTFVGKVMSLLFNMLSRFVIAFLPRSKHLLIIAWLPSLSTVILEPGK